MVYLGVDFFCHFFGEYDVAAAALEIILSAEVGVLVKNNLIHIEFVQIGVKQRNNYRLQFHGITSLNTVGV